MIRVLVVEDNPDLSAILHDLLAQQYRVEVAGSGEEAVKVAQTFRPEVVLMDLQLPGMGGIETAQVIKRELAEDVAIIVLTAHAHEQTPERVLRAGCDAFLAKPTPLPAIQAKVEEVVAARGWERLES